MLFRSDNRGTKVTELTIGAIPAGGSVELRCHPPKRLRKACPFSLVRRSFRTGKRKVSLEGAFKGRRLAVGTVLDGRALAPGIIGKVRIERVGRSKTTRRLRCLRPGASKPTACPVS